jgi:hypothetical protein
MHGPETKTRRAFVSGASGRALLLLLPHLSQSIMTNCTAESRCCCCCCLSHCLWPSTAPGARHKHCNCIAKLDKENAVAKAKMFPHLKAWVRVGRRIPQTKNLCMICQCHLSLFLRINVLRNKKMPLSYISQGVTFEINPNTTFYIYSKSGSCIWKACWIRKSGKTIFDCGLFLKTRFWDKQELYSSGTRCN